MSHLIPAVGIKMCTSQYGYKTVSAVERPILASLSPKVLVLSLVHSNAKQISEISLEMTGCFFD